MTASSNHRVRSAAKGWLAHGAMLGTAVGAIGGLWLSMSCRNRVDRKSDAVAHVAPVPKARPTTSVPVREPRCAQRFSSSPRFSTRKPSMPQWHGRDTRTFVIETDCGPLTRSYVVQLPSGDPSSAPVLILLHDSGQDAGEAQASTRWAFNGLVRRHNTVVVYADGSAPKARTTRPQGLIPLPLLRSSTWQTEDNAHPAVDDVEYLRRIVEDLRVERGLAPDTEVFLAGYGAGALMALTAAFAHPDRYSGVAVYLPSRAPRKGEFGPGPASPPVRKLRSVFVMLTHKTDDAARVANEWGAALGGVPDGIRVTLERPGAERIDAGRVHGVELQLMRLSKKVDPFPVPGGANSAGWTPSLGRPHSFDGAEAAWKFMRRNATSKRQQ